MDTLRDKIARKDSKDVRFMRRRMHMMDFVEVAPKTTYIEPYDEPLYLKILGGIAFMFILGFIMAV